MTAAPGGQPPRAGSPLSASGSLGEARTLAPLGRREAPVVEGAALGAYRLVSILDADGPRPRPGQFYMLATAERWGGDGDRPYLSRAFSHARAHEDGRLDFLLEAVGPGTERLAEARAGEGMLLVGPLGAGFRADPDRRPLLVGGGIGAAPVLALADELGAAARTVLGFRSAAHAEAASLFPGDVALATDDGSAGRHGLVTELLREALDAGDPATVFACGPPPMLEAVRALCAEREVPAQLAMESGMACGYGACFGCVVPTRSGYVRLCVDGPVLDAADLETALVPGAGH
ncbi:MAG TPA: dihydroorotate dehydrogenase electron transfer subunit [Thermoleophilaceae bacterium]|jgi:NAD(P)H-flavin reductase